MELYVFRHARAGGNRRHILNGSKKDVPLTLFGRKQARDLVKKIKVKPDIIISSPMKRAKQTAKYFSRKHNIKIEYMDLLKEHDLGDWTSKNAKKIKQLYPQNFFDYEDGTKTHFIKNVPNGESWKQTRKRAKRALEKIKEKYKKHKIVIAISHGILIMAMINLITGINPPKLWSYRLHNCEYVKFIL